MVDEFATEPAEQVSHDELLAALESSIEQLPKEHREVVKLHMLGFKTQEIANEMKFDVSTVYRRFHQARLFLHRRLRKEWYDD
jgi:RNA polymerase sigma factor (sigma-70 family)